MSLKPRFLYSHLDFFQDNLGAFSEEHGEIFHQAIQQIEKQSRHWDSAMMGDYMWSLIREDTYDHKRKVCSTVNFWRSYFIEKVRFDVFKTYDQQNAVLIMILMFKQTLQKISASWNLLYEQYQKIYIEWAVQFQSDK